MTLRPRRFYPVFVFLALSWVPAASRADIICPDSSYVRTTFTGSRDRILITPGGGGGTLAGIGVRIHVYLRNCAGAPMAGVPAQEIVLFHPGLCICPGGNTADAATDAEGHTTFSGTIQGGGCVDFLSVFADGVALGTVPVKTHSPDASPISPCVVDASDLAAFATVLGRVADYSICFDFNNSGGPTVDSSDLPFLVTRFGIHCP